MATLFVTVLVEDADTAVETMTFPVTAGIVAVKVEAVDGTSRVTSPPPEDLSLMGIRQCSVR